MRAVRLAPEKTGVASRAEFAEVPRQEELRDLPAGLFGQFARDVVCGPLVTLSVYDDDFHAVCPVSCKFARFRFAGWSPGNVSCGLRDDSSELADPPGLIYTGSECLSRKSRSDGFRQKSRHAFFRAISWSWRILSSKYSMGKECSPRCFPQSRPNPDPCRHAGIFAPH